MYLKKTNLVMSFTILFLFALTFSAWSGTEYRKRGNRYEGVKPKLVGDYDIELISALAYKED
jgi:hypothetical protein